MRRKDKAGNGFTMRQLYQAIAERQPEHSFYLGVDLCHCYHSDRTSSTSVTFKFYHHATETSLIDETIGGLAVKVTNFLDSPLATPVKVMPCEDKVEQFLDATKELPHAVG